MMIRNFVELDSGVYSRPQVHMNGLPETTMIKGLKVRSVYNTIKGYAVRKGDQFYADTDEFLKWISDNTEVFDADEKLSVINVSRFFGDTPDCLDDFIIMPREIGRKMGRIAYKGKGVMYSSYDQEAGRWGVAKSAILRTAKYSQDQMVCHRHGLNELCVWLKDTAENAKLTVRAKQKLLEIVEYIHYHMDIGAEYRPATVHLVSMMEHSSVVRDVTERETFGADYNSMFPDSVIN